jgi:ketosteroid isomerase-like protein
MRRMIFLIAALSLAVVVSSSCAGPEGANAGNRTANAGNSANNAAPATVNTAAIEADIKKMATEMAAAQAKNDLAAVEKMWGENYMFVGPDGAVVTGKQRLDSMRSGESKFESVAYDEMSVRANPEGTGAVLIGRATVKGTNMGKPVDGQYRITQVWAKTKDGWKLVSGQATPITGGSTAKDDKAGNTNSAAGPAGNAAKPPPPPANK